MLSELTVSTNGNLLGVGGCTDAARERVGDLDSIFGQCRAVIEKAMSRVVARKLYA